MPFAARSSGLDRGLKGTLVAPSSYFMKSPPRQIHDDVARERVEAFIRGDDNETLVGTEARAAAQADQAQGAGAHGREGEGRGGGRLLTLATDSPAASPAIPRGRPSAGQGERKREVLTYWLYRAAERLISAVPRGLVLPAAAAVGNVAYDLGGPKRQLLHENLARPMGLPPTIRASRAPRGARSATTRNTSST